MSEPLRIVGPWHKHSGYSKAVRGLLRCALVAGYNVQAIESDLWRKGSRNTDGREMDNLVLPPVDFPIWGPQWEEVQHALKNRVPDDAPTILLQLPGNLRNWPHYAHAPMIGYTMTESDNLCREWAHGIRCVDYAVAPSLYVQQTFERVVPEVSNTVMPIPVDDRIWRTNEHIDNLNNVPPFLFMSIFQTSERKNWRMMCLAFAEEFAEEGKEVGLLLKASDPQPVNLMAEWCRHMGAWVQVDNTRRTDWSLSGMYRACNIYVQPSSEGYGLGPVEAALCGKPSIGLALGGLADIVTEETGYVVPSHMAPIPGHMPQWYDRKTHNFATCEIDDLRATMRRAYEDEKAGANKGIVAHANAIAKFTPEAVAPKLREVVEDGRRIFARNNEQTVHPQHPFWATVAGAWGDVFCCVGNILEMMRDKEIENIGIIFYGRDPKIADWLHAQKWCREVVSIIQPDKNEMTCVYGRLCQCKPEHGRIMFHELIAQRGLTIGGEIAFTQMCLAEVRQPKYWCGASLPMDAHAWADSVRPRGDFLLVNPLSIASNTMADHWPYWGRSEGAIAWLLGVTKCTIVLVGEQEIPWPEHPLLVNLTGRSRTMMDVLALAERSAGIITTGNNLGIYAPIAGIPAVVVIARTAPRGTFYHRWYEHPENAIVEFESPLSDFQTLVTDKFPNFINIPKDLMTENDYYEGVGRP